MTDLSAIAALTPENAVTIVCSDQHRPTVVIVNGVRYVPEDRTVLDLVPGLVSLSQTEQAVLRQMDEERWFSCKDIAADAGVKQGQVKVAQQKMTRMGIARLDFLVNDPEDAPVMRGRGYLLTPLGTKLKREAEEIINRRVPNLRVVVAPLCRLPKPLITDAVLLLLSEGDKTAHQMSLDIEFEQRFERLRQRWGHPLSKHQVYAAMGGLRSKRAPHKSLIAPVNHRVGIDEVYYLTGPGITRLRELQGEAK